MPGRPLKNPDVPLPSYPDNFTHFAQNFRMFRFKEYTPGKYILMKTKQNNLDLEFFHLFQMTPDLVCVADKEGYFKMVNDAVVEKLGYSREELFAMPIHSFIHPEDKQLTSHTRSELLRGKALMNFQNRYLTKNGTVVWLHWTSIYIPEREIVFAIAKDVTQTKVVEYEVTENYKKFRTLATHFKSTIEHDRKFLALELHEELAQLAAVIKMDITWLKENLPEATDSFRQKTDHTLSVTDRLINGLRRITYALSPNMLEDLGLNDTLEWLCEDFSLVNGISCTYERDYNLAALSYEIQLDFFRICQEALNNVAAHASASEVKVTISTIDEKICLSIIDDGIGFDLEQVKKSSGLTNMKTRAASINGQLTITSGAGEGTHVCLTLLQSFD